MSMFSEIQNESTAEELLVILQEAIKTEKPSVIKFTKQHIYPMWCDYMGDVYRELTDDEVTVSEYYKKDISLTFIKK